MLLAILVVYNCKIEETKTLKSLLQNYAINSKAFENFKLIIYDNSLLEQKIDIAIPFEYQYVHHSNNNGLAVAYNYALSEAVKASYDWLLLLDQDSSLPEDFIASFLHNLSNILDSAVAAVVPKMRYKNTFFSPSKVSFGGTVSAIDVRHEGICNIKNVNAIGSGTVINVSFLQRIGGFNEVFWMDCLDRWLFLTINNMGGKVYVTDSIIEHELSIMNYDKFMNEQRYHNILMSETLFMKSFKPKIENYVYYLRLVKRVVYLFFTVNDKKYSSMTLRHLISLITPTTNNKIKNI
ncbi:MAG: glycosyltransferase [Bacteroidales bacterium]